MTDENAGKRGRRRIQRDAEQIQREGRRRKNGLKKDGDAGE